jgi:hypothetical protein
MDTLMSGLRALDDTIQMRSNVASSRFGIADVD